MRKSSAPSFLLAVLAFWALSPAGLAHADSAADAEALVRDIYYEGFPLEAALGFDADAVARLSEMLAESSEAAHHGNIVLALGLSGHADAFDALVAYASSPARGEVDRAEYRARTRVPIAMGHLARSDSRALAWLLQANAAGARNPGWRFRHQKGKRLSAILEEQTLTGLALSGSDQAAAVLDTAAARAVGSDVSAERRRRHVDSARALRARIATEGAAPVLSDSEGVSR